MCVLASLTLAACAGAACMGSAGESHDGALTGANGMTLYTFDKDAAGSGKSLHGPCAPINWPPLFAMDSDMASGDYSIVTRDDGKKQWAFKGKRCTSEQGPEARRPDGDLRQITSGTCRQAVIRKRDSRAILAELFPACAAKSAGDARSDRGGGRPRARHAERAWSRIGEWGATCAPGCSASCTTCASTSCGVVAWRRLLPDDEEAAEVLVRARKAII